MHYIAIVEKTMRLHFCRDGITSHHQYFKTRFLQLIQCNPYVCKDMPRVPFLITSMVI